MNLLGLVKDSFEAVVHEVESACQRDSTAGEYQEREAQLLASSNSQDGPAAAELDPESHTQAAPQPEPWTAPASKDADGAGEPQEPISLPAQLQLLAEVLQQASTQLSAGADESSTEDGDAPEVVSIAELHGEQAELRKLFESRIHSDEVQSRTLERLHQELKASRAQLQRKEMEPLLKDVIFCHDFVTRELQRDESGDSPVDWQQAFALLGQMLLDVLFKYDVEPFRSDSEEFDRSLQQCVRTEQTSDPNCDKSIATFGLTGFRSDDRIVRREQVTVFRYRPPG